MNIAERLELKGLEKWLQQGFEQGFKQGFEQGLQQGRQESLREVAIKLLSSGMDPTAVKEVTGLSDADMARLNH